MHILGIYLTVAALLVARKGLVEDVCYRALHPTRLSRLKPRHTR